ncbi:MAG: HAD-IA family hydrolase [Candidatus Saccharimonadales bacterium]
MQNKRELIRQARPASTNIRELASGQMNDMILVDEIEIFRFPRNDESRQRLHYESRVLGKLQSSLVTAIPRLIHVDESVPFAVLGYIKGEVVKGSEIRTFTGEQKDALAVTLAEFMKELNEHLDVRELDAWTVELMSEPESWDAYYQRIAHTAPLNQYAEPYRAQYDTVMQQRAHVPDVPVIAIHGDLHSGNMLFTGTTLAGIIDFGDCETGTIYNELRPLYSLGEDIAERVIAELDDALGVADLSLVLNLAIMHELSVLARSTPEQLESNPRVGIAKKLLGSWLGEGWDDTKAPVIKAIIFDCFGVLTSEQWIPFRRRHFHTDDARDFAQRMMGELVTGKIAQHEFVSTIAEEGNVAEDDVRESLSGSSPDKELFTWIAEHKSSHKISMLSNAGSNMLDTLFTPEQLIVFDDIVLSYEVGLAKPDIAIFRLAADRLGLRPDECLFVDDKASFCDAARRTGMMSIRYEDYHQFINEFGTMQE